MNRRFFSTSVESDVAQALHAFAQNEDHSLNSAFSAALNGSVGAAEAYMDGLWACDDLVALVRILVRNRDQLDSMERGPARLALQLLLIAPTTKAAAG